MKQFHVLLVALTLLAASPLRAAAVKPGLYKGTVVFTQTVTTSGVVVKRTFPLSGRIQDNGNFFFISPPESASAHGLDGRYFGGILVLGTAFIGQIFGRNEDGNLFLTNNLPATYAGTTLKLTWDFPVDLGGFEGPSVNRRVFVLKRVGN